MGNASAASIPLAIHDAVRDGVLTEPSRIFAPGYGAGAVAGYPVLRVDPAVVATVYGSRAPDGVAPQTAVPRTAAVLGRRAARVQLGQRPSDRALAMIVVSSSSDDGWW